MKVYELIATLAKNADMDAEVRFAIDKDTVRALNTVCDTEDANPPEGILLDEEEFTLSVEDVNNDTSTVILIHG